MAGRRTHPRGGPPRRTLAGPRLPSGLRRRGRDTAVTALPSAAGPYVRGLRFLRRRWPVLLRLAAWSVLETGQTFLLGYALARALDDGFLAGRAGTGLAWLAVAAVGVLAGAYGTGRVYGAVAALVEPLRDRLVTHVVTRGVREADDGALSGLTQQVEIARDTFAGLVMVARSFVFTAVGALAGLLSLAPPLLLVVGLPLAAGVALFAVTLRPLARRQAAYLTADEALAARLGALCPGLRDITASGAEERIAADVGQDIDAELRAARSLARFSVLRTAALAVGGHLPAVLLAATTPWLLTQGVTPGALLGALAYIAQSLLPALRALIHGLGTSGARLTVVLRRLLPEESQAGSPPGAAGNAGTRTPRSPEAAGPRPDPAALPTPAGLPRAAGLRPVPATPPTPADSPETAGPRPDPPPRSTPAPGAPALRLWGVTFSYGPAAAPVIDDLDLVLPSGAHVAVVGPSGAGKSTLTALVAGLLEPGRGVIRVYGEPVPSARAAALRVLLPQEAYVTSATLAENLALLRPDPVPEPELLASADAVGLTPLLERLGGPDAPVDPAALSAGERQLIALARAHLSRAPLVLLDEATCHLDPAAEERAEQAFAERAGRTLIVVAHRISSARRAGHVLVLDGPRTAYGTHDELPARSPLYRDLVGHWSTPSDPAPALRYPDGVDAVTGTGLPGDGRHVVAHRPVGQVQAPGDLRDGSAPGGQG
ncbi:ATP-binding cassette domain-containing protein [Streptomyces mexicanus]|uniref:ATP-binding cassette domain-containing protein n=1 Tax=Streptomyces mexicanus TaxID=178566 RepID=UPI00301B1CE4